MGMVASPHGPQQLVKPEVSIDEAEADGALCSDEVGKSVAEFVGVTVRDDDGHGDRTIVRVSRELNATGVPVKHGVLAVAYVDGLHVVEERLHRGEHELVARALEEHQRRYGRVGHALSLSLAYVAMEPKVLSRALAERSAARPHATLLGLRQPRPENPPRGLIACAQYPVAHRPRSPVKGNRPAGASLPCHHSAVSYSGAGLYDDDAGADARGRYRELVADGIAGADATDALIAEWGDALLDPDEAAAFWLALADTQWKVGRLEDEVRDRALRLITTGEDLARFAHDRRLRERRAEVLAELDAQLRSPQRAPTRLKKPVRSVSAVGVGDVFWFEMPGDRRALLRCVAISGDERDNYPTAEVLDWDGVDDPSDCDSLVARKPARYPNGNKRTELLVLVRYPRDPDPAERIRIIATGTAVTRRRTLPATHVPWVELPDWLAVAFGL